MVSGYSLVGRCRRSWSKLECGELPFRAKVLAITCEVPASSSVEDLRLQASGFIPALACQLRCSDCRLFGNQQDAYSFGLCQPQNVLGIYVCYGIIVHTLTGGTWGKLQYKAIVPSCHRDASK